MGGNDGMVQVVIVVEEKKNAEKAYFFRKTFSIRLWQDSFLEFLRRREKKSRKITKKKYLSCVL